MTDFLFDGPENAGVTVLLAHGAGAPMDSPSMTLFATALTEAGMRVARFEFGYMAARRSGTRRPPPPADRLIPEYAEAISNLGAVEKLIVGGKSMGGRVASMAADELFAAGTIKGLLCLGYPFHPPGKPDALRTAHLEHLETPCLICQGTRDPFGTKDEVPGYKLSLKVEVRWFEDGDHDLKPRKKVTGATATDYARVAAEAVAEWSAKL
ncbi:alpha/beta hydrolase family protein [Ovoidimarina sediminis]|uniref:alpha/beta hydrolase family protein n=1 Tax=Ovoidimarina sediminis TaxID=3079856 RepID=UPI00290C1254|nr:alpha/beta family hydrolase [Rhodophyticola sp. MJ-SS7]MDU8945820.1 alpha/beta family hydrolase [Rhodophyticola sp. MJ-SS7]